MLDLLVKSSRDVFKLKLELTMTLSEKVLPGFTQFC